MSDSVCYFCGEQRPTALEEHHLVPRRLNGSDQPENLVTLCGACHNKVEELYDDEFYERLGIAVDAIDQSSGLQNYGSGSTLQPKGSIDAKILYNSTHIQVEEWAVRVTVEEAKWAKRGDYRGKLRDWLEDNAEAILEEYNHRAEKAQERLEQRPEKGVPDAWSDRDKPPAIRFEFEHDDLASVPHVIVVNPQNNGMEGQESMGIESDRETLDEATEFSDGRGYDDHTHYRIHCSYCHTVFGENQHSDVGRHLQLRHGIERDELYAGGAAELMEDVYHE